MLLTFQFEILLSTLQSFSKKISCKFLFRLTVSLIEIKIPRVVDDILNPERRI